MDIARVVDACRRGDTLREIASVEGVSRQRVHEWLKHHDHETMKWRSVICKPCNTVLGYVEQGWNAWAFVKTLRSSDGYGDRLATVRSTHAAGDA